MRRRDFLKTAGALAGGAAGLGAGLGPLEALARTDRKRFSGVTLNVTTQTCPYIASAVQDAEKPSFDMTGAKINLLTSPFGNLYTKVLASFIAGTSSYDVVLGASAWMGDFQPYVMDLTPRIMGDKSFKWSDVIYQDKARNVLAPQWAPGGERVAFGIGVFNAFFNGFNGLFLKPEDRVEGGAQIAFVNPDGSNFREVTTGPNNNAFPSIAPDGKRMVYRTFGPEGDGLRIMNLDSGATTKLTEGYDNFPLWSPRGDLIMFSRLEKGDYEIFTIRPDSTGVKRLTHARGNDAHQGWSPDGEYIVFASTRMGYKDEMTYTDAPQPYGELFVMRYDGSGVEQLTDNQWEEGTPAWQPTGAGRRGSSR